MGRGALAVAALIWGVAAQAQDVDYGAQAFYRMEFGGPQAGLTQSVGYVAGSGQLTQRTPSLEYRWSAKASEIRLAGMPLADKGAKVNQSGQTLILGLRPEVFWTGVAVFVGGTALIVAAANDDDDGARAPVGTGSGGS